MNPDIVKLEIRGISLENFNIVTHPSQPNHAAARLNHGGFVKLPEKVLTIVVLPHVNFMERLYENNILSGIYGFRFVN